MNATKLILTQDRLRRSHTEDAGLALYEAALAGECAVAEALHTLPGVDVNQAGYDAQRKETALHAAARRGHADCVRLLVLLGADLEAIDSSGRQQTALAAAVLAEMHTSAAALLELGANATQVDVWGYDPLWYAVRQNAAMVDLLLQWGADPNRLQRSHTAEAESAFHLALKLGRYDEVRTMLRWGADLTKPTKAGKTPQEMAAELLEKMVSQTPSASESDGSGSGGSSPAAGKSATATDQGGDQEGGKKTLAGHHAVLVSGAVYFGHNRGPFHGRWWRGLFRWFLVGLVCFALPLTPLALLPLHHTIGNVLIFCSQLLLVPGVRDCFPESLWFALGLNTVCRSHLLSVSLLSPPKKNLTHKSPHTGSHNRAEPKRCHSRHTPFPRLRPVVGFGPGSRRWLPVAFALQPHPLLFPLFFSFFFFLLERGKKIVLDIPPPSPSFLPPPSFAPHSHSHCKWNGYEGPNHVCVNIANGGKLLMIIVVHTYHPLA